MHGTYNVKWAENIYRPKTNTAED
jgi:hypothetical protein